MKKAKSKGMMSRVRPDDVQNVGNKSLNVIEAAFTLLEHLTADAAKAVIDRLSGGKHKAK